MNDENGTLRNVILRTVFAGIGLPINGRTVIGPVGYVVRLITVIILTHILLGYSLYYKYHLNVFIPAVCYITQ